MLRVYDTAKARGHTNYILPFARVNVPKLALFWYLGRNLGAFGKGGVEVSGLNK